MKITFKKEWFNTLYFILNDLLKDEAVRTILVYGGKGSSKTISICQALAKEAIIKNASSIAFRKECAIIQTTLKKSFNLAIKSMYLHPAFRPLEFSFKASNSEIVLKGLDDKEKAKGIESYKYLYLDELNHFSEGEFLQFKIALRGINGQKILASWNPVDENSWVKTKLIDKHEFVETKYKLPSERSFVKQSTCGKIVLIKTVYQDNYWINGSPCGTYGFRDQNLIDEYEWLKFVDLNFYNVNVLGEWGIMNKSGKFAYAFDEQKHTGSIGWDANEYTYLTFDFNMNPITCSVIQHINGRIQVPFALKLPNSNIYSLCDVIKSTCPGGLFIVTGDATGQTSSAMVKDKLNYYTVIKEQLGLSSAQIQVNSINPTMVENRVLINALFQNYPILIDKENASILIYELKYGEVDENNKLVKDRSTDKKNLDSLDNFRYYCNRFHKSFLKLPKNN